MISNELMEQINSASKIVNTGGLIAYPTDTVYGFGCDPENTESIERLFEVKKRENKAIPILFDNMQSMEKFVYLTNQEKKIGNKFWPGALTIIAKLKKELPSLIHQNTGYIGVRIPNSEISIELIKQCNGHLTGTSANISNNPSIRNADDIKNIFKNKIDYVIDGGLLKAKESTIIKIENNKIIFLRDGDLKNEIEEYFESNI